ncbi:YraN family protein [Neptunomonas japonica]|uniref:YraN family protein n=1 Tax=Neptunomonas japonica TaxID=417574 RepID=UPI000426C050|nr:YraN family protein [Neptunomonas japonica]
MDRQTRGKDAETKAWHWLIQQGLKPVTRNYLCKLGEIDLILVDNNTLVFAEVRYRTHKHFGGAANSVTTTKQKKIIRTAQHFLMTHSHFQQHNCRFDVIAYETPSEENKPVWYKDAFRL